MEKKIKQGKKIIKNRKNKVKRIINDLEMICKN